MLRCCGFSGLLTIVYVTTTVVAAEPLASHKADVYQRGAVAADHPAASEAGVSMLRQGGNVIDAAVATAVMLSVVRPGSSGLGGGGFLLFWDATTQRAIAYDYRERAPLAATAAMFADQATVGDNSRRGIRAVAVPGEIAGLCKIHQQHGKLPLATVLEPALAAARDGFVPDLHEREAQQSMIAEFKRHPDWTTRFARLWNDYLNRGVPWKPDERWHSPQRPALELLARTGLAAWETGPLGQALIEFSQQHGGLITTADLAAAGPVARTPLQLKYRGDTVLTMPPPSSGGLALMQTMQALVAWEQRTGRRWKDLPDADRWHVLIEIWQHAFADRAEYLGDADFVKVPVQPLSEPAYAERIAARIDLTKTLAAEAYGRAIVPDDQGTSHFSVMDAAGNAVACTETINTSFGSLMVEPRFGIVLNNEMDDFTAVPGQVNAFGLRQSPANAIAPRKKPLSSMTPTIVLREGRPIWAVGASGGPRIITTTIQVLLNGLEFNRSAQEAVSLPRGHHQWYPREVLLEAGLWPTLDAALRERGHRPKKVSELAASQAIRRTTAGFDAGSDSRKHGRPAGW